MQAIDDPEKTVFLYGIGPFTTGTLIASISTADIERLTMPHGRCVVERAASIFGGTVQAVDIYAQKKLRPFSDLFHAKSMSARFFCNDDALFVASVVRHMHEPQDNPLRYMYMLIGTNGLHARAANTRATLECVRSDAGTA